MPSAYRLLPHYTYEDYCQWEGQWELIDGIPHAMSPAPRPEHQRIAGNLHAEFRAALKQSGCVCSVYQPIDYKIADDTVLNPDLLIVCKPISKAFLDFAPELVVEILSPATAMKDRHTKLEIYKAEKIKYYIIVDADMQQVEIFELRDAMHYERHQFDTGKPFDFHFSVCRFSVLFDAIWA